MNSVLKRLAGNEPPREGDELPDQRTKTRGVDLIRRAEELYTIVDIIGTDYVTVKSLETRDGGKAGMLTEVTAANAAALVLDMKAVLIGQKYSCLNRLVDRWCCYNDADKRVTMGDFMGHTCMLYKPADLTKTKFIFGTEPPIQGLLHARIVETVAQLQASCFAESCNDGWEHNPDGTEKPIDFPRGIALIHSELSEALEGDRKSLMDTHLPHRRNSEVELADAVIRIFVLGGKAGFNIAGAMSEKMAFNRNREKGGKKY